MALPCNNHNPQLTFIISATKVMLGGQPVHCQIDNVHLICKICHRCLQCNTPESEIPLSCCRDLICMPENRIIYVKEMDNPYDEERELVCGHRCLCKRIPCTIPLFLTSALLGIVIVLMIDLHYL